MITKRDYVNGEVTKPDMTKRYWYCSISEYYPLGFPDDITATCDTLEELYSLRSQGYSSYEWEVFWDNREYKVINI